jgi:hypothetical protein
MEKGGGGRGVAAEEDAAFEGRGGTNEGERKF